MTTPKRWYDYTLAADDDDPRTHPHELLPVAVRVCGERPGGAVRLVCFTCNTYWHTLQALRGRQSQSIADLRRAAAALLARRDAA